MARTMNRAASFATVGFAAGLLAATAGFALFVRGQGARSGTGPGAVVLKLGHGLDVSHPVHVAMDFMAKRVAEKSAGAVEIRIFPNSQLGSEPECTEQVQRGALAMVKSSTAQIEGFIPDLAVLSLPFLFRDSAHQWRVLDGPVGRELLLAGEEKGVRGLCFFDAGGRSFYTVDSAIRTPDDLRGRKIRVMQSRTMMDMITALGGAPTPIPFGELYTALQQKMVDGAENNAPSLWTSRHFEVARHYSLDEHAMPPDILLISAKIWRDLPPAAQTWVQEAADEASMFQRELWRKRTAECLADLEKAGVEITRPDKSPFAARVQPMYDALAGTRLGDFVARIRAQ
jgi:tripartite ATP-independent transporter DctP family solute receptor